MQTPETRQKRNSVLYFGAASLLAVTAATAQVAIAPAGIDVNGACVQKLAICWANPDQANSVICKVPPIQLTHP